MNYSGDHLPTVLFLFSLCAVYEVFERMAYYGISSNLVIYLTTKLHQGTVKSSNNVTNWVGTIWITPILGAYVADAHLGRYWTFVVSSVIYISVRTSTLIYCPSLKPLTRNLLLIFPPPLSYIFNYMT
ncbi:hypothetical protein I3760_02G108700 [Carya illinoinensis]|nr:hypothetical protein I3760_02G108700 [Carya illinoinensis]